MKELWTRYGHYARGRFAETLLLTAVLAAPLAFVSNGSAGQYLSETIVIYAGAAVGLTVLLGVAKQFHLAQAAFMAFGAYTAAVLGSRHGPNLVLEFLIAAALCALVGLAVGASTLRLRGLYFALSTLAFVLIVSNVASNWTSVTHGNNGFNSISPVVVWDGLGELSSTNTYLIASALLLLEGYVVFGLKRSTYWGCMKLVGDSAHLAGCIGVNVLLYRVCAFVVVSMTGGLWGVLFAHVVGFVDPNTFGLTLTVQLLMMVVVGGMGSFWGALVGAVILLEIPQQLSSLQSKEQLLYAGILLVVILVFAKGILPSLQELGSYLIRRARRSRSGDSVALLDLAKEEKVFAEGAFEGTTLEVTELVVSFGGVHALRGASLSAAAGRIEGLIGTNGSGKTTMLNAVSGIIRPNSGSVVLDSQECVGRAAHHVARLGLIRTFQTPQVVLDLSVLDNAVLGWHQRRRTSLFGVFVGLPGARREERRQRAEARETCINLGLGDLLDTPAAQLSTGDRRFVEIARALGSKPRLLFLDEPATGMTGLERDRLMAVLRGLRRAGLTLVVIDHDMEFLFQVADHVTVLDRGENIAVGSPAEVRQSPAVMRAYFGEAPISA